MNQSGTLVNAAPDVCREFAEPVNRNGDSPLAQVAQHEFELVQTRSSCASVITRGGASRMVEPCVSREYSSRGQRLTDITTGAEARVDVNAGPQPAERTPTTPRPIMLSSRSRN